ncbi:hypothetical protein [Oryza sativa Japonica Group]|uniref:Uncharacterized protein n=1 Tax=Oryza sativa subsp. japonica TaxID=39947 RepID=Q94E10_ORYSJ|nr:hypothetical protein [Oryza sativa Japonica Group]
MGAHNLHLLYRCLLQPPPPPPVKPGELTPKPPFHMHEGRSGCLTKRQWGSSIHSWG